VNGGPSDDPRYDPLWATLEQLDRTVWVHGARSCVTQGYYGEQWSRCGLWASLGWPYEMGMFEARMVASGVPDRYPRLRFCLHHSAGMVPTFSRRVNALRHELPAAALDDVASCRSLKRPVAENFRDFSADTSGQTAVAIRAALEFFGPDHVLIGTNAPLGSLPDHTATVASLHLTPGEHARLIGGSARRLLHLDSMSR
jgi:aminocarboxymuconate-semialdehyde decarboxylase